MVQQNGVYHRKTVQERELEKRVTERRRELMESYRSQKEERKEVALTRTTNTETQRSVNRGEEFSSTVERATRPVRDEMEGRVGSSLGSNGLHSTPAPERQSYSSQLHDDRQVKRTPSFELNAGNLQSIPFFLLPPLFFISYLKKGKRTREESYLLFYHYRWSCTLTNVNSENDHYL